MEIRTKFDLNQKVWVIDINNSKWKVIDKFKIVGVTVVKDRVGEQDVDYELDYGDGKHFLNLNESICFKTEEEAQKECERRNGKE